MLVHVSERAPQSRDLAFLSRTVPLQILPPRIPALDQPLILFATPALQLFLAVDRVCHVIKTLPVDEAGAVVIVAKAFEPVILMLPDAFPQIVRHADVQRPPRSALHDVDVINVLVAHVAARKAQGPSTA